MMTPHIEVTNDPDGVRLTLKGQWLVLPPTMAIELATLLINAAHDHDPLGVRPLPQVTPIGDPIK